jgi:hypothetical protein
MLVYTSAKLQKSTVEFVSADKKMLQNYSCGPSKLDFRNWNQNLDLDLSVADYNRAKSGLNIIFPLSLRFSLDLNSDKQEFQKSNFEGPQL